MDEVHMIPNYVPYARTSYNGERRPINHQSGEWMTFGQRKFVGWSRILMLIVGSGLGWGVAIGLAIMAMEMNR